ncbi:MAG: DNA translocase FtsK 4TM domain-containing protein [Pirellulaceae bacterium]
MRARADRALGWVHQADPVVSPQSETVENVCGRWGAWVADASFAGLGYGAYFALIVLGAIDATLLRRQAIDSPWLRTIGFLVALLGCSTLLGLVLPEWSPGPVIGSGGYLGAMGSGALRMQFAMIAAVVLAALRDDRWPHAAHRLPAPTFRPVGFRSDPRSRQCRVASRHSQSPRQTFPQHGRRHTRGRNRRGGRGRRRGRGDPHLGPDSQ